ncbi:2-dehydropantoate 2-reductase N-terminal domain-containing protein [Streptomyces sp. NPDC053493]|uniref:lactate/malate family dehydrogenase n=1 Tax=Streptomyces sp. NPDC053493 TaxID=3365705 RepID=UPI0037CE9C1B
MTTIGLIGAGAVGQTVGTMLAASGWCDTIMVASGSGRTAASLVTDLEDMGQVTGSPLRAIHAAPSVMGGCDAIVVCPRAVFTNTQTSDVRMAGLHANAPLIAAIARRFTGYQGVVVMVTNPVDVMTRLFAEVSGCGRVFGVGSNTDTARYRLTLARLLNVPVAAVHGHVVGEHGDNAVICASSTTVNGQPVPVPLQQVRDELRGRPRRINEGIGRVRTGPAGAAYAALRHALGLTDGVIELSAPWRGDWYGMPLRFAAGTPTVCLPPLDSGEAVHLQAAAAKLNAAYDQIKETRS